MNADSLYEFFVIISVTSVVTLWLLVRVAREKIKDYFNKRSK